MSGPYTYRLYNDSTTSEGVRFTAKYTRAELEQMTTFQLRSICTKERLVEGLANPLDRDKLIQLILRYRGADSRKLITVPNKGGFERLEQAIRRYLGTDRKDSGRMRVPAKIVLYEDIMLDRTDGYRVEAELPWLDEGNVLIVNREDELCGVLNLVRSGEQGKDYYLCRDSMAELRRTVNQHYSLLFFRRRESDYLYEAYYGDKPLVPTSLHAVRVPVAELVIRQPERTDAVLAIDFGTSNTTAGAYLDSGYVSMPDHGGAGRIRLNDINYVQFPGPSGPDGEWLEVLPTAVAVEDCSNPKQIVYAFGEAALRGEGAIGKQATVLRGIKRWVNDYKRAEELIDPEGRTARVPRSEILGAFIRYVVGMAEQQFKCRFHHLHISAPVKLKTQFIEMFTEIVPEYRIEAADALDEGVAVLYNTLADQMERRTFTDGREYQALVIDCGGGTTDLSSCRFRIEDGRIAYKLDIHTTYENGDTNFGGNNLTYRIMQYMKIVFAGYYAAEERLPDTEIQALIRESPGDIYRYVDEHGVDALYAELERRYREAEAILPTAYRRYEHANREEYERVLGNFHLLWDAAENMKREFFRRTGILRSRFETENVIPADTDLNIAVMNRWMVSVLENGRFREEYRLPDVIFNIREIEQLLKADIYGIVRRFLEDLYQDGRLQDYSIIKLTGQSCRIDVFREALKEFVPGRSIEFRQKPGDQDRVSELKLACVRGAIRYLNSKKMGRIEPVLSSDVPAIPYAVSAYTHTGVEKVLIESLAPLGAARYISRPSHTAEVEFFLSASGASPRRQVYHNRPGLYRPVTYEEIAQQYGKDILQDDTDSISNGETRYFVFTGGSHWGFHVVPVARQDEMLQLGEKHFFAFEDDLSELDFFDGTK
ncbi:molecular chaperone [Paenibacillus sp. FSL M8-0334]|uniref:Molecular chaperone n=1 Tax=Paenibacillus campinasensis TaxID=66347 RepID=A0ABW9T902_9BACL|nr:molecular chaperone [Paenibacillus campinasensis]MUG68861.1 molecular chaperone [Paenibacillus campinasensis]